MKRNRVISIAYCYILFALTIGNPELFAISIDYQRAWNLEHAFLSQRVAQKYNPFAAECNNGIPANASNVLDTNALILSGDKSANHVLVRRTRALLNYLIGSSNISFSSENQQLITFEQKVNSGDTTKTLFFEICKLRRKITFANPLLNFDEILVTEENHRRSISGFGNEIQRFHNLGKRGGGIFKISGFKTDNPTITNLLPGTVVPHGTKKGLAWTSGGFNSIGLSDDAKKIVFSWAQNPSSAPGGAFNIYIMNIDGTDCRQLTSEDSMSESHGIFMPNGRILFVTERRQGFVRCGGGDFTQKTATLHSMNQDGSDLICLSYHETNELHPAIDNDGRIVYTRWDYIDRDFNAAHGIWHCNPDGTDPRAWHGNYPYPHYRGNNVTTVYPGFGRSCRPWAEMFIKPIPNASGIYSCAATQHHQAGHGPIVLININVQDDNMLSQIKRVNMECGLPNENYTTAAIQRGWYCSPYPLSDAFYLASHMGSFKIWQQVVDSMCASLQGIYIVDKFGNSELIFRDPSKPTDYALGLWHPTPLIVTKPKPVIPSRTWQEKNRFRTPEHKRATILISNVYESDFDWPAGIKEQKKIKEIRIIQILAKPWFGHHKGKYHTYNQYPQAGYQRGPIPRLVLGTVPVEDDGSAYFEAPVEKEIYFQAVDERGLAIQSMRSGTYVHPGEQMSCVGCHENKWKAVPIMGKLKAMSRPPSVIKPDVSGSCPVTFARLAYPVFEKKCTPCHREKGGKAPIITLEQIPNVTAYSYHPTTKGYQALEPYAFYFHASEAKELYTKFHGGSRSQAGNFGAMAAPLFSKLNPSHNNVNLTQEEFHRITLWLDCNSMELGSYSIDSMDIDKQLKGELVLPEFEVDPNNLTGVEFDRPLPTNATALMERNAGLQNTKGQKNRYAKVLFPGSLFPVHNLKNGPKEIRIHNLQGKVVQTHSFSNDKTHKNKKTPRNSLPMGVYLLQE